MRDILILMAFALFVMFAFGCKSDKVNTSQTKRSAKELKAYGPEVKQHEESLTFENIYPNNGNDQKLSTIASDYLGRNPKLLNVEKVSKEFKPDYVEFQFSVDELPLDLKGLNTLFSKEDRVDSKGKSENVIMEFATNSDAGVRSQHTMVASFSPLANSEEPTIKYGFDKEKGKRAELKINKLKSADFSFVGNERTYILGAAKPLSSRTLELKYDIKAKKYKFISDSTDGILDMDKTDKLYKGSKEPLSDDMKYCAIVNNIKAVQNKFIKSGGYYQIDGILRFLPNMKLSEDFPLRSM